MEIRFPLARGRPADEAIENPSDKFVWTGEHAKAVAWWAAVTFLQMQAANPWEGLNSLLYVLKSRAEFEKVPRKFEKVPLCGDQLLPSGSWVKPLWTAFCRIHSALDIRHGSFPESVGQCKHFSIHFGSMISEFLTHSFLLW